MVGVAEVDLGVDTSFTGAVQKVRNEGKRIAILLGDLVECPEVDAETQ